MSSHTQFGPGRKANSGRIINYVAEYNARFPNSPQLKCMCVNEKYDKNIVGSESASTRCSYNTRISQIIKNSLGGSKLLYDLGLEGGEGLASCYAGNNKIESRVPLTSSFCTLHAVAAFA